MRSCVPTSEPSVNQSHRLCFFRLVLSSFPGDLVPSTWRSVQEVRQVGISAFVREFRRDRSWLSTSALPIGDSQQRERQAGDERFASQCDALVRVAESVQASRVEWVMELMGGGYGVERCRVGGDVDRGHASGR